MHHAPRFPADSIPIVIGARTYQALRYGLFTVVGARPLAASDLDTGDLDLWSRIGLLIDPPALGNDYQQVLRVITAWAAHEAYRFGTDWGDALAAWACRIYLAGGPVIIPFGGDLSGQASD